MHIVEPSTGESVSLTGAEDPMPSTDHDHRLDRLERVNIRLAAALEKLAAADHPMVSLKAGERHVLRPGEMLLIHDGFFYLEPTDGDAHTARAPRMAGLLEEAVGEPVSVQIEALKDSSGYLFAPKQFYSMAREHPWCRQLLYALYEYELFLLTHEARAYRKHMHEFYAPSSAALLPGPYEGDDVDMVGLLMRAKDPCWTRRMLPPGVFVPPGLRGVYAVVLAHFRNVTCKHPLATDVSFDYRETTVFIPCVAGLRPGMFSPILFPDNAMAITLGREIYGFPKRFGRTVLDMDQRYAELEVDDKLEFWCEWDKSDPVQPRTYVDRFVEETFADRFWADKVGDVGGWFFERLFTPDRNNTWPAMSVFVRKQLPDVALPCERDLVYESDRLVRVPFDMSDVKSCHMLCNAKLHRGRKASFLPKSDLLLAGHVNLDMGFGVRQELHSHLGPLDKARLVKRRMQRTALRMSGRIHGGAQLGSDFLYDSWTWLRAGAPSREQEQPCQCDQDGDAGGEPQPE